ncbi:RNA polymerase III subunit C82 [Puccinia graminis f. sp. tritici]|uniref:RNA polymerase III subunit C82 n=1 Tax=Puccinia graminis f. sp. tritici TaxID=56615 RepID=A0A5B0S2F2_PUCGR|nr:RNA polymerase III subunit C82 [Puccinia graminis f. sp. tritici]
MTMSNQPLEILHQLCNIALPLADLRLTPRKFQLPTADVTLPPSDGSGGNSTLDVNLIQPQTGTGDFPDEIFTWVRFGQFANSAYKQFGIESKLIVRYLLDNGKLRVGQLVTMFSTNLFLLSNEVSPMASRTAISPGLLSSGEDLESLEEVKQLLQEQRQGSNSAAPESF